MTMKIKSTFSKRKLVAYGLGIGGCGALLASSASAQDGTLDVIVGFGNTLDSSVPNADGATNYGKILGTDVLGNTVAAGVGNFGWSSDGTGNGRKISLNGVSFGSSASKGFYHDQAFGAKHGKVVYEPNTAPHTFGLTGLPNVGLNDANFDNFYSAGNIGHDQEGVVGFLSSSGHWGYLEFDWIDATSTLNILSAKIQRHPGQPITFTPSVGTSRAVPEPSSLLLLTIGSAAIASRRHRKRQLR